MQTTHDLDLGPERVTKTFLVRHGDEARREWGALTLLARAAPGLAPEPLELHDDDQRPTVVMTRVAGTPWGGVPLIDGELDALASALVQLHGAVPADELARMPLRRAHQADFLADARAWIDEALPAVPADVQRALAAGRAWLGGPEADLLAGGPVDLVFTHGDGNVANLVWDGAQCRVVDFEDAGTSDLAYELADLLEHVSVWLRGIIRPEDLLDRLDLTTAQQRRVLAARRLFATFWLLMLLPGHPADARNPAGSLERQAARLLELLRST